MVSIGAAYQSGFLDQETVVGLISGRFGDDGHILYRNNIYIDRSNNCLVSPNEIRESMKRTGFDLVMRGIVSPRIGPTYESNNSMAVLSVHFPKLKFSYLFLGRMKIRPTGSLANAEELKELGEPG